LAYGHERKRLLGIPGTDVREIMTTEHVFEKLSPSVAIVLKNKHREEQR
jgi:hypothetical protein